MKSTISFYCTSLSFQSWKSPLPLLAWSPRWSHDGSMSCGEHTRWLKHIHILLYHAAAICSVLFIYSTKSETVSEPNSLLYPGGPGGPGGPWMTRSVSRRRPRAAKRPRRSVNQQSFQTCFTLGQSLTFDVFHQICGVSMGMKPVAVSWMTWGSWGPWRALKDMSVLPHNVPHYTMSCRSKETG